MSPGSPLRCEAQNFRLPLTNRVEVLQTRHPPLYCNQSEAWHNTTAAWRGLEFEGAPCCVTLQEGYLNCKSLQLFRRSHRRQSMKPTRRSSPFGAVVLLQRPLRMQHEHHDFRFSLIVLAALACAFLLGTWMATKTIFFFLQEAQIR